MSFVRPLVCQSFCLFVIVSCPLLIFYTLWEIFIEIFKSLVRSKDIPKALTSYACWRAHLKVQCLSLKFRAPSISPLPFWRNFMKLYWAKYFGRYTEDINQSHKLKVKVTPKERILSLYFRASTKSPVPIGGFSWNLAQMCITRWRCANPTQGQVTFKGQTFELGISWELHISREIWLIFSK